MDADPVALGAGVVRFSCPDISRNAAEMPPDCARAGTVSGYMTQLAFDLARPKLLGRVDFFASAANTAALSWIERWPDWPSSVLVLHGDQGAGKTHLAHLWCERAGATLLVGGTLHEAQVER